MFSFPYSESFRCGGVVMFGSLHRYNKIQKGRTAKMSMSEIVDIIINLMQAKSNLPPALYYEVRQLYNELHEQKDMIEMDIEKFQNMKKELIDKFDEIAPYEFYDGEIKV